MPEEKNELGAGSLTELEGATVINSTENTSYPPAVLSVPPDHASIVVVKTPSSQ